MKIAFYMYTLNVGGAETIVTNYLIELKKRGHEVFLIENFFTDSLLSKKLIDNQIPIFNISKIKKRGRLARGARKIEMSLFGAKRINSFIKKNGIDVIHFHSFNKAIKRICLEPSKIAYTIHSDINRHFAMIGKRNDLILQKMATRGLIFIGISKQSCEDISRHYGPRKLFRVNNGLDLKLLSRQIGVKNETLDELKIPSGSFVVGHIGRFDKVKNHEKVISVFVQIKRRLPNAYLVLVGGYSKERIETIKELLVKNGIDKSTIILGVRNDAIRFLNTFDVLLFPSFSECMPLAVIEALALGKKCVVSENLPEEIKKMCIALSLKQTDEVWADACVDLTVSATNCFDPNDYEIGAKMRELERIYAIGNVAKE